MLSVLRVIASRAVVLKTIYKSVQAICLLLLLWSKGSYAGDINVAVSSNFIAVAKELVQLFEDQHGVEVSLSFGSTGKLFAQIHYGAPFDLFLAADEERPAKLVALGDAVKDTQFTYAMGKIALYSKSTPLADLSIDQLRVLLSNGLVAMANPKTAPYGVAAQQTLAKMGVLESHNSKRIYGENIAQTYQFIETGNVKLGFVSLSQMIVNPQKSYWLVPEEYYLPLKQDAVLLKSGADNPVAKQFLHFLHSQQALSVIQKHGYGV